MEEHTPVMYQEMEQMGDTTKVIFSLFQVNNAFTQIHIHIKNFFILIKMYEMRNLIIIIGGHVIHSYGRLVHFEHVITRGDQLLPPGDGTAPGRMDCIRTAPETASFQFDNPKPSNNIVYPNVEDPPNPQMATLLFNRSYLSMNSLENAEGFCVRTLTFFHIFLSAGTYRQYAHIQPLLYSNISFFLSSLAGKLSNVTIVSAEPGTTDTSIVIRIRVPSGITRPIVGYERHVFGVTLQGRYKNYETSRQFTFSSLVPGARYTVVAQGLSGTAVDRSQHVTRRDVKTTDKSEGYRKPITTDYLVR